jgi:serine/threonine-protein phosphatase 2A regulatory subunit B
MTSSSTRDWRFTQCFGEQTPPGTEQVEADILSSVEFDSTGKYLATGDKGGRIVVFEAEYPHEKSPTKPSSSSSSSTTSSSRKSMLPEYKFHCEFQSHDPEFDYLKSLEIEEKINQIKWCRPSAGALFLLSTNDKTIKLWKIFNKHIKAVQEINVSPQAAEAAEDAARSSGSTVWGANSLGAMSKGSQPSRAAALLAAKSMGYHPPKSPEDLVIPRLSMVESVVACHPRRIFANAHAYHINSISVNCDGQTFLSADDLRINLWHLEEKERTFNVVDIKPENMEDLTEVITAAEFHPSQCNTFAFSTSRGAIKLGDMRRSALCDVQAKVFEEEEQPGDKSFFSEIIASISDVKFTSDGRYIVARDYLSLKIWDIKMETRPVKTIQIHEYLRPKLCDLYENDCIFDKFECCVSPDGKYFATGSYSNFLQIYDRTGRNDVLIEATSSPRKSTAVKAKAPPDVSSIDFSRKAMNLAWHPTESVIAVAASNNLYLYAR